MVTLFLSEHLLLNVFLVFKVLTEKVEPITAAFACLDIFLGFIANVKFTTILWLTTANANTRLWLCTSSH